MKYCIVIKGNNIQDANDYDSVGFYQWLNVFHGQLIQADDALNQLNDGDYDIVHLRLSQKNLTLIQQLRERLGQNSKTKIVSSLDIPVKYWRQEFNHLEQLKAVVSKIDFVFATEFHIAQALEKISGKKIYEIPYPADFDKVKTYPTVEKGCFATIFYGNKNIIKKYVFYCKLFFNSSLKIRVLSYRYENTDDVEFFKKNNIEYFICKNEVELYEKLAESRFIVIPDNQSPIIEEYHPYDNLIVYSAIAGTIVLGSNDLEIMRRCFSELTRAPLNNYFLLYWWIQNNKIKMDYLIETAKVKVAYYDWGNLQKILLDWLYFETDDKRFYYHNFKIEHPSLFNDIHYRFGPKNVDYNHEEFVVVCLVKNGAEYIKTFINYYQNMGARHFFFIDNGSTDETIALLKLYQNITIYETELPHKKYECEIRRAIIEEHCKNGWCLCVDIDELFDYPFSEQISMKYFLRYLNLHQYTAVLSYLLDMFSKEIEFSLEKQEEDIVSKYCYYDVSKIKKTRYNSTFVSFTNYNQLSDKKMKNYSGGIRRRVFKSKKSDYLLTKHPLIFIDSNIEPVVHPHFCNKALIADVNGVLKHYKFINTFKDKVIRSLKSKDYTYYAEQEYKEYLNVIQDKNRLSLYSRRSRKLENIEQLVRTNFLRVSKLYKTYINGV
jgi:hypothetical protein